MGSCGGQNVYALKEGRCTAMEASEQSIGPEVRKEPTSCSRRSLETRWCIRIPNDLARV